MRSPFTLLTLLVLALLAINAAAWTPISKDDEAICRKKNGDAAQAIQSYCSKAPYVRNPSSLIWQSPAGASMRT